MAETVGDFVARRLHEWGVRRIYGYPGDGINGITAGLRRLNSIEFVQVRRGRPGQSRDHPPDLPRSHRRLRAAPD